VIVVLLVMPVFLLGKQDLLKNICLKQGVMSQKSDPDKG
jgi:hypothetical protein